MACTARHVVAVFAGLLLGAPADLHARATGTATGRGSPQLRAPKARSAKQRLVKHRRAGAGRAAVDRPGRRTRGFVRLPAGRGYTMMRPHRAWGTRHAVKHLSKVLAAHHADYPEGPPLTIGDLSRRGGGRLRPHRSHRNGRDVDIWLPKEAGTKHRLDLPRTWSLISALRDSGAVEMIFLDYRLQRALHRYAQQELGLSRVELAPIFEYPSRRRPRGPIDTLVIHTDGHRDHMHVRFNHRKAAPLPTS